MKTLFLLAGFIVTPTGDINPTVPMVVLGLDLCLAGIEIYEAKEPRLKLYCIDTKQPLAKRISI